MLILNNEAQAKLLECHISRRHVPLILDCQYTDAFVEYIKLTNLLTEVSENDLMRVLYPQELTSAFMPTPITSSTVYAELCALQSSTPPRPAPSTTSSPTPTIDVSAVAQTTDALLAERGSRYGNFMDHATHSQKIKDIMRSSPNWERMKPDTKESLELIAHKIARALNGDPEYDDNFKDIAGYATLVAKRINGESV